MRELFEQCQPTGEGDFFIFTGSDYEFDGHHIYLQNLDRFNQLDHLQVFLQNAIVARGWGFTIRNMHERRNGKPPVISGMTDAHIYITGGEYPDIWSHRDGETAVEALLAAYIDALRYVERNKD